MTELNSHGVYATMGARNHFDAERQTDDYYATDPRAVSLLCDKVIFHRDIWECACGEGHLSKALISRGYTVMSTDLVDRGYGTGGVDFLQQTQPFRGDIITNPPYSHALQFCRHALELVPEGYYVAMLLRLLFLEGVERRKFFKEAPPRIVYVFSRRVTCAPNGDFEHSVHSAQAFAWFLWQKGYKGAPEIRWID